ncbi:MAG: flagellar hook protein FlgE [Syntrophales bacterium]
MGAALWIGTTGLNASSMQIDVIGNNLANSNTPGYKADNMYFSSLLTQSLATGANSLNIGQGVRVSNVSTQFAAGAMQSTGNATDLAIDGDGFFAVKDATGAEYFTRAGAFHTDKNNNLVDSNGYFVQGYNPIQNTVTGIGFGTPISGAMPTANILTAGFNLDSDTVEGGAFGISQGLYDSLGGTHSVSLSFTKTNKLGYWGLESKLDTDNYAQINPPAASRVDGFTFDSNGSLSGVYKVEDLKATPVGGAVTLDSVHYGKLYKESAVLPVLTFDGLTWTATNKGGYDAMTVRYDADTVAPALGKGTITLSMGGNSGDADITLTTTSAFASGNTITLESSTTAGKFVVYGASTPKPNLAFQYEDLMNDPVYIGSTGDKNVLKWDIASDAIDTSGITSYAATSETRAFSLDGWTQGTLKSVSFDADGKITGYFTNGQTKSLGQLQLARFTNPAGLKKVGNYFTKTELSGSPTRNYAGSGGVGDIRSNALEISNTDVTVEFINMMTAQRAYQANARVITADDQNFQQLISIKR